MFELLGGHIALDFVNTLDNRHDMEAATDLLATYDDLVAFLLETNAVSVSEARGLRRPAAARKSEALAEARQLREALYAIFASVVKLRNSPTADLNLVNAFVRDSLSHRMVETEGREFAWRWKGMGEMAGSALWPVSYAAAELLVSPDLALVRECQNGECRWLFLDKSKNHSRRWCDMKICGNRTKARRYYQRHSNG